MLQSQSDVLLEVNSLRNQLDSIALKLQSIEGLITKTLSDIRLAQVQQSKQKISLQKTESSTDQKVSLEKESEHLKLKLWSLKEQVQLYTNQRMNPSSGKLTSKEKEEIFLISRALENEGNNLLELETEKKRVK